MSNGLGWYRLGTGLGVGVPFESPDPLPPWILAYNHSGRTDVRLKVYSSYLLHHGRLWYSPLPPGGQTRTIRLKRVPSCLLFKCSANGHLVLRNGNGINNALLFHFM